MSPKTAWKRQCRPSPPYISIMTGASIRSVFYINGAAWCPMVYNAGMAQTEDAVRQSVSIPARIAKRVRALAKRQKTSANRVLVDLIEAGLESKEAEKQRFFALANQLTESA